MFHPNKAKAIRAEAEKQKINFRYTAEDVRVSLDETISHEDLTSICNVFSVSLGKVTTSGVSGIDAIMIPDDLFRQDAYLTHPVFSMYRTETEMMRYVKSLENKDLSLMHAMIPLGSCTMKLNAASEMFPVSYPEFSSLHPFVPAEQAAGYHRIFDELSSYLIDITGMSACSSAA